MMQTMIAWFLVMALPHVIAMTMAGSEVENEVVVNRHVVVQHVDGDSEGQFTIRIDKGDGDITTQVIDLAGGGQGKVVFVGDVGGDGQVVTKVVQIGSDKEAADRGWLGVSIGNVPDALATQMNISKDGLAVLNVVDGGPADKAGIRTHDVIISLDGEAVTADFSKLTSLLADRKPGDTVEVAVLQDGQEKVFDIELGSHEDVNHFAWKFDAMANLGEVEELVHTTAKIVTRDENGEWNLIDLGDLEGLEALPGLPDSIRLAIPKNGDQATQVFFRDGKRTVKTTVTRDGESISVSRENGGDIIVTRTDFDGNKTEAVYATDEDLEAADAEAFELFSHAGQTVVMKLDIDGGFNFSDGTFDVDLNLDEDFDLDAMKDHMMVWRQHLDDALGDANDARVQMQEQLEAMLKEIQEGNGDGLAQLKFLPSLDGKGLHRMHFGKLHGQVRQSFEVRPDGTIAVTVRKGDAQVITLFTGEDDLADRAPDLFEKYLNVVGDGN